MPPVDTRSMRTARSRAPDQRRAARATPSSTASRSARCTMGSRMKIHDDDAGADRADRRIDDAATTAARGVRVTRHTARVMSNVVTDRNGTSQVAVATPQRAAGGPRQRRGDEPAPKQPGPVFNAVSARPPPRSHRCGHAHDREDQARAPSDPRHGVADSPRHGEHGEHPPQARGSTRVTIGRAQTLA